MSDNEAGDLHFTLKIRCESDAFAGYGGPGPELARLLHKVAERVAEADRHAEGNINDVNGALVGGYTLSDDYTHGVTVDVFLGHSDDAIVVQLDTNFEPEDVAMRVNLNDTVVWHSPTGAMK